MSRIFIRKVDSAKDNKKTGGNQLENLTVEEALEQLLSHTEVIQETETVSLLKSNWTIRHLIVHPLTAMHVKQKILPAHPFPHRFV